MSRENVEIVRGAFSLLSIPGDPDAMIAASTEDFEMHLIGVTGEPVHYAGASGSGTSSATWHRAGRRSGSRAPTSTTSVTAFSCLVT